MLFLILCSLVVYALCPRFSVCFSILITSLGEEGASRTFACACIFLSFFSSSWCRGLAAVCDCCIPWNVFNFLFFILLKSVLPQKNYGMDFPFPKIMETSSAHCI